MQIQKPKQGYQLIKSLFGKYEEIPQDWDVSQIHALGKIVTGSTPSTLVKDYYGDEFLWAGPTDLGSTKYIEKTDSMLSSKGFEVSRKIPKKSVLMVCIGSTIGKMGLASCEMSTNQQINSIICRSDDPEFVYYQLLKNQNKIKNMANQAAVPILNKNDFGTIKIIKPKNIREQQKIASILSNVDSLIQLTQKEIEQTQRLKRGLMQRLFTKGIRHTKFKTENIGKRFLNVEIPDTWDIKQFGDIITIHENYVELDDNTEYFRVIVKRRHEGIILRDVVKGKEILTKNQYQVKAGNFIISRRQIIHNACGLILKEFDGAVVSNEYSTFSGSKYLDIDYFDWFSQTELFKKTIIVTTHGVDIEKYVFLLDEWLKLKMPLPSISEQKKIVEILLNVENKLTKEQRYKSYLESLKKGVMQKLLTGKIRVKL